MKGLFKSKPRTPPDIVRQTHDLLAYADRSVSIPDLRESKRQEKLSELSKNLRELKLILYGNSDAEPVAEACAQLTQEFFKGDTLRRLINSLQYLNLEARKDATQVVANLQRQQVNSRLIASDYLESNIDLMDFLVDGFENTDMALHYGTMFRECIRHQILAELSKSLRELKLILYGNNSEAEPVAEACAQLTLEFFKDATQVVANLQRQQQVNSRLVASDYLESNTDLMDVLVDGYVLDSQHELLTRHKSTVAEFLTKNEEWTSTQSFLNQLLGDILLDRSNSVVMTKYESSKTIQIEAFHVSRGKSKLTDTIMFVQLFVANQKKPSDIINVLVANRNKLLRLLADLKLDKEDESFEADKAHVVSEIASLKPRDLA
ncbi:hypothetical protein F2Q70_00032718 [Brassica cretica]|uniref:Uncharacterized protein n=1 Tax=Brassica cretica TaxID=69181 RepID=A0A8S9FDN2_BRACR|nr:hypothetical protein F2Q70_00032718 [Brassica cretica]